MMLGKKLNMKRVDGILCQFTSNIRTAVGTPRVHIIVQGQERANRLDPANTKPIYFPLLWIKKKASTS